MTTFPVDKSYNIGNSTFIFKDVVIMKKSGSNSTIMYVFARGKYYGEVTVNSQASCQFTNILKYTNNACYWAVNNTSIYTNNFLAFKIDFENETVTEVGQLNMTESTAGWEYTDWLDTENGGIIWVGYEKPKRYNEVTNTVTAVSRDAVSAFIQYVAPNYILNPSTSGGYIDRITWDKANNKIAILKREDYTQNVRGVNYYGNKVFSNRNIYELNQDLTIGNLLKENAIPDVAYSMTYPIYAITTNRYAVTSKSNSRYITIMEFDEETNTFTVIDDLGSNTQYYGGYHGGHTGYFSFNTSTAILTTYEWNERVVTDIGFKYNGYTYFYKQFSAQKYDKVLSGTTVYDELCAPYEGSMPDNGALNYTPTTSQQTIPAGYTSGGIIEAIDYSGQGALSPQDTATAEAQIEDLFGEGE